MTTNAQKIRVYQQKIDSIILDLPKLVGRLELVIPSANVWNLLEDDPLGMLCIILAENLEDVRTPPVIDEVLSVATLQSKLWEYPRLRSDVIEYFRPILSVLGYATLSDLCAGRVLDLGNQTIDISNIYNEYAASQPEKIVLEAHLEDPGSSSSSTKDN